MKEIPANAKVKVFEFDLNINILPKMDGDLEEMIDYLKGVKKQAVDKGAIEVHVEPEYVDVDVKGQKVPGQKLTALRVYGVRKETPEEYWERVDSVVNKKRQEREKRYQEYLDLKKEFENDEKTD